MNRFKVEQRLNGVRADLKAAANKLEEMYSDSSTTMEQRAEQAKIVKDLEEREAGLKNSLKKLDDEANAKLIKNDPDNAAAIAKNKKIENKASLIRAVMDGNKENANKISAEIGGFQFFNTLSTNGSSGNGGSALLPKTTSSEIITEPVYENDLRDHIIVSQIAGLEIPRLLFSIDDDEFVADEETAKEIKAAGDTVAFGRNKSKLKANVSETIITGTDANLVETVDSALEGAAAYKEAKQLFAKKTDNWYKADMSFYGENVSGGKLIKEVEGSSLYVAIKKAIAALPKLFRKNAKVVMTYTDYLDIIESLANQNASFYTAQPETIFGRPIVFMDEAETPIVGDLRYLQINYDPQTLYDRDKDVDTGIEKFVLTNWYDIKFRLRSAFRLVKVNAIP